MRNRIDIPSEVGNRTTSLKEKNVGSKRDNYQGSLQPICLFGPERYEPRYDYPLVVWLHSDRSGERELEAIMPALSMQNYVGCAPRGPVACDPQGQLYRWGNSPTLQAVAEELVFDAIEAATQEFSVHRQRVFLAGFGGGGTMAWRLALRHPQRFAGVLSICGEFPEQHSPLAKFEEARDLPTLWIYGEQSRTCGIDQVCNTLPLLHAASLSVDIRQYPCGDELLENMLSDANSWLMQRVTQQPISDQTAAHESFSRN